MQKLSTAAALVGGIVAGLTLIVVAVVKKEVAFGAWGAFFVLGSIIAVSTGSKGTPDVAVDGTLRPKKVGAKFSEIPPGAWLLIALLFVGAIAVTVTNSPLS
jgi:hypothetical protein